MTDIFIMAALKIRPIIPKNACWYMAVKVNPAVGAVNLFAESFSQPEAPIFVACANAIDKRIDAQDARR